MSDVELPMRFELAHSVPKSFKFLHFVTSLLIAFVTNRHLRRLDCLNIKTVSHAQSHSLQIVRCLKAPLHDTIRPHGACRLPCTWVNRNV